MEQSEFGLNLSYYRNKCGLTQEHLAQLLMVTPQTVSKWKKGSAFSGLWLCPRCPAGSDPDTRHNPDQLCGQLRAGY